MYYICWTNRGFSGMTATWLWQVNTDAEDFFSEHTGFQRDSTAEKLRPLMLKVGYIYVFPHNLPVW